MTRSLKLDSAMHFTILRNPVDAFESLFHYIDMAKFYNVSSLPEFIKKLNSSDPIRSDRLYGLGRNQLSFNLGLPVKHFDNMDMIKKNSKEIEKRFDLVMIFEYFEESLIFLKNLLEIPLINVMSTKSNARHQESKHILTVGEKDILSKWLKADIYLYQLFRRKFEESMTTRITEEAKILRKFNDLLYQACNVSQHKIDIGEKVSIGKATLSEPFTNKSNLLCNHFFMYWYAAPGRRIRQHSEVKRIFQIENFSEK
ncbi:galactose-3-O-sulfotransferase 2-like [Artemia franciscana]|uniref:galactose-3-O-sulfotransferase 2-like n=1 Tax=Artemia franciscana TaxID=6661 RepID=UPI0032DBC4AC